MRSYSSTQPLYNLLSPPINPHFAVHPAAFSRSATGPHDVSLHNLKSPIHPDPGCHLLHFCLACPPPACKTDLSPKRLHRELLHLRNPSTPHRATA